MKYTRTRARVHTSSLSSSSRFILTTNHYENKNNISILNHRNCHLLDLFCLRINLQNAKLKIS